MQSTAAATSPSRDELAHPARPTRNTDRVLRRLLATADVLAITAALAASMAFVSSGRGSAAGFLIGVLTLPGWVVLFKAYGLYDRDAKRISHSTVDDLPWIAHALLVGSLAMWFLYRLLPGADYGFAPPLKEDPRWLGWKLTQTPIVWLPASASLPL